MTPSDKYAAAVARGNFAREVLRPEGEIDLARAALWLAAEDDPRADVEGALADLESMGAEARASVEREGDAPVAALNRYLFEERGFSGDRRNYYDPRNSFLHEVLARRTGIPITLSVVYMEVGRRAGLQVEGVGMPGHFIVRARGAGVRPVLVDPFHGQIIDEDDCQARLDEMFGGQVALTEEHLRPTPKRAILMRMLTNLKSIYTQAQHYRRALAAVERILLIAPQALSERRDRGILLARLERFDEARADLQIYLNLNERAPDAEAVREHLNKIKARHAMLN